MTTKTAKKPVWPAALLLGVSYYVVQYHGAQIWSWMSHLL